MGSTTIRTMGVTVLVAVSAGLMGCPPENASRVQALGQPLPTGGTNEVYDIEDYWPMAVGNEWGWSDIRTGDRTIALVTLELFTTFDTVHSVWEVYFAHYSGTSGSLAGPTIKESVRYFVFLPEYLVYTDNLDHMQELVELAEDTSDVSALEHWTIYSSRNIAEGIQSVIDITEVGHKGGLSAADTIGNLTPYGACRSYLAWKATDFPVSPRSHSIMWTSPVICDDGQPYDTVQEWLAKGVGPIVLDRNSFLTYAVVDGVEYTH